MPAVPKRYLLYWKEDWEKPLLKENDPVARSNISEKYWGLVFRDIDDVEKVLYIVSSRHTEYEKGRKGGWAVLAKPFDCDKKGLDFLEPFHINEDTLIYLVQKTDQPTANNMNFIFRNRNNNAYESK